MERLAPNPPEIIHLREHGINYPPVSFILYETTPYTYSEALFLYLVMMRRELSEGDVIVGSVLENFETSLKISAIPTPLISLFKRTLQDPKIHFKYHDSSDELLKTIELHFRSADHIYLYITDPLEATHEFITALSNIIKKIKNYTTRTFSITTFIDEKVLESREGGRLRYQAEFIFKLVRSEKSSASLLKIMKTKYMMSPSIILEYTVGREGLSFQSIRTI